MAKIRWSVKERNEVIAVRRLRDTYCRRGDVGEVELKRVGRERWKRICGQTSSILHCLVLLLNPECLRE